MVFLEKRPVFRIERYSSIVGEDNYYLSDYQKVCIVFSIVCEVLKQHGPISANMSFFCDKLNEYVEVKVANDLEKAINDNDIIVIAVNKYSDEIYRINEICRTNKKGFVYAGLFGLAGFIFCDFGNHLIIDENSEEYIMVCDLT